jgi:hypothetical protein
MNYEYDTTESERETISDVISLSSVDSFDDESDDNMDAVDRIFMDDITFVDEPRRQNTYYIANVFDLHLFYILGVCISPRVFFRHQYHDVVNYMYEYVIHHNWSARTKRKVDIIQLYIEDNTYKAVIKTHWLRLIQRHWKRVYQERKKVIRIRSSISCQRHFQTRGRYLKGANYLPTLQGMLVEYNNKYN